MADREPAVLLTRDDRAQLSDDLAILLRLHDREPDAEFIAQLRAAPPESWFALRLDGEAFAAARAALEAGLRAIADPPDKAALDDLAAEYAAIHLTYAYRAAPNESVWRDEDGLERQAMMFDVRRWYTKYGVQAPDWRVRSDDHLVNELQFLAHLLRRAETGEGIGEAATFLRDHILVWVPLFAGRVAARGRLQFFAGAMLITVAYLQRLGEVLGALGGLDMTPPPPRPESAAVLATGGQTCADPPGKGAR